MVDQYPAAASLFTCRAVDLRSRPDWIRFKPPLKLGAIARIDALYTLLDWAHRPRLDDTRSMLIEKGDAGRFRADNSGKVNEFKHRPVLPSPHHVARKLEPAWPGDRPLAAEAMERPESPRLPTRSRAPTSAARTAPSSGAPAKPASPTIGSLDLEVPGTMGQPGGGGRPSLFVLTRHPGQVALVTLNKADRSLRAAIEGVENVVAQGPTARTLFQALPDDVQQNLEKRPVRLLVTWESEGVVKRIVALGVGPPSSKP
jgi:hypothetical protein